MSRPPTLTTRIEPYWYLRSIPYSEYRQTRWWKQRREAYLEQYRDDAFGIHCECCEQQPTVYTEDGEHIEGLPRVHIHHRTYVNLGNERDEDLAQVCSPCHNLIHYPDSAAARFWLWHSYNRVPDLASRALALRPTEEPS